MLRNANIKCPTCREKAEFLAVWDFSGLNNSIFNYTAKFYTCPVCGLVYIANILDKALSCFYNNECSYFENAHFDVTAPENIRKFEAYREILQSAGLADTPVTDVGCGRGGFLTWLIKNGWRGDCTGVDIDFRSIPSVKVQNSKNGKLSFQEGIAFKLPFSDASQSILSYFHVLEHIRDLDIVLREANRALKDSGYIFIEVPDAERYQEYPVGSAFWFSIREHVNHFTGSALGCALWENGFSVVMVKRQVLPTPEFFYPSLMVLARKGVREKPIGTERIGDIAAFVLQSKKELQKQAEKIRQLYRSFGALTFWGCSAELFSLLPILNISDFAICDSNVMKQQCYFKDTQILDPKNIPVSGALIVAPYLHGDAIEKAARELGWPEESVFRLK